MKSFPKSLLFATFATASFLLLTACGTHYDREYSYIAPTSDADKTCTKECMSTKLSCEQSCGSHSGICKVSDRLPRQYGQRKSSLGVILTSYDSGSSIDCKPEQCFSRCNYTYNQCFQGCGGKVVVR